MITKWDDLTGKTITGFHYHSGGVVLLLGDEFAVVIGKEGHYDEGAFADLANQGSREALEAAVAAEAPGAQQILDIHLNNFAMKMEAQEMRRLKYLQNKYKETD